MAAITWASAHNLVCCSALKCHKAATTTQRVVIDSATRRARTTGEPIPLEVAIDWCDQHNPEG